MTHLAKKQQKIEVVILIPLFWYCIVCQYDIFRAVVVLAFIVTVESLCTLNIV